MRRIAKAVLLDRDEGWEQKDAFIEGFEGTSLLMQTFAKLELFATDPESSGALSYTITVESSTIIVPNARSTSCQACS